jgi:hypothetical protein
MWVKGRSVALYLARRLSPLQIFTNHTLPRDDSSLTADGCHDVAVVVNAALVSNPAVPSRVSSPQYGMITIFTLVWICSCLVVDSCVVVPFS